MKYTIRTLYAIEIEVEADSIEDAQNIQDNPEYRYSVYAVFGESGKDIDSEYIEQSIFELKED